MSPGVAVALKVVHVCGIVLWVGGMLAALATAVAARSATEASRTHVVAAARSAMALVATPGLLMAWAAGLTIAISSWDVYRSAGWLHAKITCALLLAAIHGMAMARMRKAASGGEIKAGMLQVLVGIAALLAVGAVTLVVAQPF